MSVDTHHSRMEDEQSSVQRPTEEESTIIITDRAAYRMKQLKEQQGESKLILRIGVKPGGCHGFSYTFHLEDTSKITEEDRTFEKSGAQVVLDAMSLNMINGSKLDYVEELMGSKFAIRDNPQVDSRCSCGTSFGIK